MADTFLKNELCDTEIFDRAIEAGRVTIPEFQPKEVKFLNLQKTVKLVAERLRMTERPVIYVADHPSPAFALNTDSNSLYITEGLYDKLDNDQLRTVMILQTCLTHHSQKHAGKYHAANVAGLTGGALAGAGGSLLVAAAAQQVLSDPEKDTKVEKKDEAPSKGRRKILKAVLGLAAMNAIPTASVTAGAAMAGAGIGAGKDDERAYKNWVQAAVADYAALNDDPDKTKLLSALVTMNNGLGEDRKKQSQQCLEAIGQFMACAIPARPSRLEPLPPTKETREYSRSV